VVPARARSSGPPFPNVGTSLEGLEHFLRAFGPQISDDATTSDVCHTIVKIQMAPDRRASASERLAGG
jgi:hypothetical protein